MSKGYKSHFRKITKLGDGLYYSEHDSFSTYMFLCLCKLMLKILFFPVYVPYKLLKSLFKKNKFYLEFII